MRAVKLKYTLLVYPMLLAPSLVLAAAVWLWLAPDRLYHCCDDVGPLPFPKSLAMVLRHPSSAIALVRFSLPPFVHAGATMGSDFDHYIWPAPIVYLTWLGLLGVALLLPALVANLLPRFPEPTEHEKA